MSPVKIIPAILENTWAEVVEKIELLEGKADWVQIDVSDGVFTPYQTWNNPGDLQGLDEELNIETHLMIAKPWEVLERWIEQDIKRFIIHWETLGEKPTYLPYAEKLIDYCHEYRREIVFAVNPETPWQKLERFVPILDAVMFLGVTPGKSGQEFQESVLDKISSLRQGFPNVTIEVDGGVSERTAPALAQAGANWLASSSFVFSFDDPAEGIERLEKAVEKSSI